MFGMDPRYRTEGIEAGSAGSSVDDRLATAIQHQGTKNAKFTKEKLLSAILALLVTWWSMAKLAMRLPYENPHPW
tara:strand:+ start:81 stop:305 length:225 start_codon:yes stop_codon:yes gene_type:complete